MTRHLFAGFFVVQMICAQGWASEPKKALGPSHLMVGPGLFNIDRRHVRGLIQLEYRWAVNVRNLRPLVAFAVATDENFFLCGGIAYDIFFGKKVVLTPSFAPGVYYHSWGRNLGFPINFRSALELSFVLGNKGRIGAQFNHISNAHMLHRNPGANTLFVFYAIPFPHKTKKVSQSEKHRAGT